MTNPTPPRTFTRDEFTTQVLAAHDTIMDFTKFLMHRFAAYTQHTQVHDIRDRIVSPVIDPFARTNAGYGQWRVPSNWMRVMTEATDQPEPYVTIEHYMDADRGEGSVSNHVRVPLSFVFGEVEKDAAYEEFLRLKAQFEPDTAASPQSDRDDEVARNAARHMLYLLPEYQRVVSVEDMLADKEVAARIYREAWVFVEESALRDPIADMSEIRADLLTGAADLGLDALMEPSTLYGRLVDAAQALLAVAPVSDARPDVDEMLADPRVAAAVYASALSVASHQQGVSSLGDIRALHAHAATLGLTRPHTTGPKQPKARLEAARVLWIQSRPQSERTGNGEHLADPANRGEAAEAYRMALNSLVMRAGLKDIRRSVHDAAYALGLGENDLREPKPQDQQGAAAPKAGSAESPYDNPRAGQDTKPDPAAELGMTLLFDLAERITDHGVAAHEQAGAAYERVQAAFTLTGKQVFGDKAPKVGSVLDDVATLLGFDKKKR